MPLSDDDRAAIVLAESRLLQPDVRHDANELTALLADDFVEIGASGRRYSRTEVIAALAQESSGYDATLADLEIDELAPNLAIVHYRTTSRADASAAPRHALRTSLWRRSGEGWQLFHHQGTLAEPP